MGYNEANGESVIKVKRIASSALQEIYKIVDKELLEAELRAALEVKCARTKVRVLLAKIANLAKQARKDIPADFEVALKIEDKDDDNEKVCS